MDKRNMGILLIIIGIIALASGIIMVIIKPKETVVSVDMNNQHGQKVVVIEKHIHETKPSETRNQSVETIQETAYNVSDATVDDNLTAKQKGDAFEDFVVNLLADWRLKLLDRTQDAVSSNGVSAESCKNPDLHVQQRRGKMDIDYLLFGMQVSI